MMLNQKPLINHATSDDIPDLVDLLNDLFSIEQDFTPNKARQVNGLSLIIEHPQTGMIKVARDSQHKVIGMVSVQLLYSTAEGGYSAWIEDMVINKDYRANGVGRALLNSALDWAKAHGASRAQLLVDCANESALGYYKHLGWQTSNMGMLRRSL